MVLPNGVLKFLKKIHYVHELKRFSERNEPDLRVVKKLVRPGDHGGVVVRAVADRQIRLRRIDGWQQMAVIPTALVSTAAA